MRSLFRVIANICLIDLCHACAVGSCLMIYKLKKRSDQQLQAKLSRTFPSRNLGLNLTPPPPIRLKFQAAFIPLSSPMPSKFQSKKPLSLGIPRCRHGTVRSFSGIRMRAEENFCLQCRRGKFDSLIECVHCHAMKY